MKNFSPNNIRKHVLEMAYSGSTVHIPCAFSIVELVSVLYKDVLRLGDGPDDPNRDYFALSKGHGVMAVYACLYEQGWLPESDLKNYFKDGSKLKGLSDCHVPGLEVTSGSLGHGLSVAAGIALGLKLKKSDQKVYCIVGDGESNEGSIWEALLFAAHWKLNNLFVIFDCNGYQAMGTTDDVMNLSSMQAKLKAFNFETEEINGHNIQEISSSFTRLLNSKNLSPKAIIANTIKGKGVSFMESKNNWHYTRLNEETFHASMKELGH